MCVQTEWTNTQVWSFCPLPCLMSFPWNWQPIQKALEVFCRDGKLYHEDYHPHIPVRQDFMRRNNNDTLLLNRWLLYSRDMMEFTLIWWNENELVAQKSKHHAWHSLTFLSRINPSLSFFIYFSSNCKNWSVKWQWIWVQKGSKNIPHVAQNVRVVWQFTIHFIQFVSERQRCFLNFKPKLHLNNMCLKILAIQMFALSLRLKNLMLKYKYYLI